jgi:hypothetical protein
MQSRAMAAQHMRVTRHEGPECRDFPIEQSSLAALLRQLPLGMSAAGKRLTRFDKDEGAGDALSDSQALVFGGLYPRMRVQCGWPSGPASGV